MPIPFILAAGALAATGVGLAKGAKGVSDIVDASDIVSRSERMLDKQRDSINGLRIDANDELRNLGQLKIDIFNNQIHHLIETIKKVKDAGSRLTDFNQIITDKEYIEIKKGVSAALELESGLLSGAAAGTLTGMGAYGSVGLLASASTGTAISTLSGAAAKSATLAWLGGGSLASGGLGMAGGTLVLGGIVTGPALAITGFHLAGKGEQALTKARQHEARSEVNVAAIKVMKVGVKATIIETLERQMVLLEAVKRFERIKVNDNLNLQAFQNMLTLGMSIKKILDLPILNDEGEVVKGMFYKSEGYLEI